MLSLAVLNPAPFAFAEASAHPGLHFIAVGDTGSAAEQQRLVAEALARTAQASASNNPVQFMLFLGDNFYEEGVNSVEDPQWQDKLEKIYDPVRLPMPFYAVLGNHDWLRGKQDVEIDYSKAHPESRWKMEAHYYKRQFFAEGVDHSTGAPLLEVFAIDTQAWSKTTLHVAMYKNRHLGDEQLAWLEKELMSSKARWKMVCAHHPIYTNGAHGHDAQLSSLREILDPVFKKAKVDCFIAGHDHDLERIEIAGSPTLFLISGAGGKLRPKGFSDYPSFFADKPGFLSVNLTDTEMKGEFLDAGLNVLDSFVRKPNSANEPAK